MNLNIGLICSISYFNLFISNLILNLQQFFEDQSYNDSISGSIHNLNEDYIIAPLNVVNNNNNVSASASSSNRYSPYSPHPKYGVYKPMEWTLQVIY